MALERPADDHRRFATPLFVALCLVASVGVDPGFSEVAWQFGFVMQRSGGLGVALYVGAYLLSVIAWALLMSARHRVVRWLAIASSLAGFCTHLAVWAVNGYGYELFEARMFFHEVAHAGDVATTFGAGAVGAIAVGALITGALIGARSWLGVRSRCPVWLLVLLAVVPVASMITWTDGEVSAFPSPVKVPVVTVIGNLPRGVIGERPAPSIAPDSPPLAPHIVLIVDESVRGDLLGINGGPDTTPWLNARKGIFNFGVACASTNSSATSNMVIQSGIQPEGLERDAASAMAMPNLFQYAREAGYRTAYLLGQPLRYWYYMNPADLDDIDRLAQPQDIGRETPRHEIDRRMADLAVAFTEGEGPTFSYLLKVGAHFPYFDKRPQNYPDGGAPHFAEETDPERREMLEDYCSTLKWVVDDYFADLLPRLEGRDLVILYTSDHGQSFREGGILATHGVTRNPPVSQANVPLLLIGTSDRTRRMIAARVASSEGRLKDRGSHFEVFPTVLSLMGYAEADVKRLYGASLFTADGTRARRFLSGDPFRSGARAMNLFDR